MHFRRNGMRPLLLLLLVVSCGPSPVDGVLPCGCDDQAAAEGRLCRRLTVAELEVSRGEVGPGWETCPPAR